MTRTEQEAGRLDAVVWRLLEQGKMPEAVKACSALNQQYPQYAPGWHSASHLAYKARNLRMAIAAIDRALELRPGTVDWILHKARCLGQQGAFVRVSELIEPLRQQSLKSGWQCATLGLLLSRMEQQEAALEQYQRALELEPDVGQHYYNVASVLRFLGRFDEAEAALSSAIALDPKDYDAYKLRSDLRAWSTTQNHVKQLRELIEAGVESPRGEVQLCYALSKELEDIEEHQAAFRVLKRGADQRRRHMRYDVGGDIETMAEIAKVYEAEKFSDEQPGCLSTEPVFIIGMPRTGTTLAERILASHSQVFAAGELNNFAGEMIKHVGRRDLGKLAMVSASTGLDFGKLGQAYIDSTRPQTGHTPHFIDKLPLNFLYAGLIKLALPAAKIVHLQRHPLDTCYAIYKTLFQDAYPFSYELNELGRYYVAYAQLMRHWETCLGDSLYTLSYEDLVLDTESVARGMLQYCELAWEPSCLDFHLSKAATSTASASQVRQPVYQSSVSKWKHYQQELQPLIRVLQDSGIAVE